MQVHQVQLCHYFKSNWSRRTNYFESWKGNKIFYDNSEATQLVIQSIELAKGGDVLLDMGEPVYIKELAKNMIKLNGLKIKDKDNPNGDIKIETV